MTTNLKSEILDNINNIALGVNTDSSLRNKLLVQLEQAESTNAFDFKIDVNFINRDKKSYVAKYLTIHQLNKIGNSELKQLRDGGLPTRPVRSLGSRRTKRVTVYFGD